MLILENVNVCLRIKCRLFYLILQFPGKDGQYVFKEHFKLLKIHIIQITERFLMAQSFKHPTLLFSSGHDLVVQDGALHRALHSVHSLPQSPLSPSAPAACGSLVLFLILGLTDMGSLQHLQPRDSHLFHCLPLSFLI